MTQAQQTQAPSGLADSSSILGRFEKVGKVFVLPGEADISAIENVTFDLKRGQLVSLLGPSGCGKTTFLRIVAGLEMATTGHVSIDGVTVTGPQSNFGFVFQHPNLMSWRTVLKNVLFPLEIRHELNQAGIDRARELLELVGLAGFENRYPSELSGGMQQRVALCRALVYDAKLLLMDEPFGALDELKRMEMHDLLSAIRARTGATVMFVTHSISEAIYLSDVVAVFSKRPSTIAEFIAIDLPYPRETAMRYTPAFTDYEHHAGRALGIAR